MTTQEAYLRLNELFTEAEKLIKEYKLISVMRHRDSEVPDTLNPDWIENKERKMYGQTFTERAFKDPLPEDALLELHKDHCGCKNPTQTCLDEVANRYAGTDLYECWIPSQFC